MLTAHPPLHARRPAPSIPADSSIPADPATPVSLDGRGQLRHALAEVGGAVIAAMSTLHTVDPVDQAALGHKMRLLRGALDEAERLHQSLHRR